MEKELLGFQTITKKVAQNIHEYLYSSIKLGDQEKATLIAGILIALENESFRNTYRGMIDEDQFIDSFMSAVRYSILKYDGLKNGKEEVISVFDYIKHNSNFKNTVEQNGQRYIALQFLTEIIHKSVYNIAKTHPTYDILGEFYNEFTRYSGADQQSLGIVLTPHHIAEFMSELLEVNDEDIILDTCIGSASLALTAENSNIKKNKVVGVEFNARMLSLAVANTMIRNIPSYLMLGDSWNPEIIEKINTQKPTKMIINPPYSQEGYPELGFVEKGLNSLQEGGICVAILPKGITLTSKQKKIKSEIFKKHSLEAVFSMPENLFVDVGVGISTVIVVFKAHTKQIENTILINLKDDGYKVSMRDGRIDLENKWNGIKENVKKIYKEKQAIENYSVLVFPNEEVELNIDKYIKADIANINEKTFIKNIRDYIFYSHNIFYEKSIELFLDSVLELLEKNPEIKKPKTEKKINIKTIKWDEFNYSDLFVMRKGQGGTQKKCKEKKGDTLYISATENNNGLVFTTGVKPLHSGVNITVSDFGKAFYQDKGFVGSHIVVLTPKEKLSKETIFFLMSMIEQDKEKYSFSRSFSLGKIKNEKIYLPVDSSGNPDWQLMEDYIKSLPYSKYL